MNYTCFVTSTLSHSSCDSDMKFSSKIKESQCTQNGDFFQIVLRITKAHEQTIHESRPPHAKQTIIKSSQTSNENLIIPSCIYAEHHKYYRGSNLIRSDFTYLRYILKYTSEKLNKGIESSIPDSILLYCSSARLI